MITIEIVLDLEGHVRSARWRAPDHPSQATMGGRWNGVDVGPFDSSDEALSGLMADVAATLG